MPSDKTVLRRGCSSCTCVRPRRPHERAGTRSLRLEHPFSAEPGAPPAAVVRVLWHGANAARDVAQHRPHALRSRVAAAQRAAHSGQSAQRQPHAAHQRPQPPQPPPALNELRRVASRLDRKRPSGADSMQRQVRFDPA
eukprot:scaffold5611_cov132-Isochrysis_galbana.AAC.15